MVKKNIRLKAERPLLSIIIPTKNRQIFCAECIRHIVSLKIKELEIIVQDNSDDDSLKNIIDNEGLATSVKYEYYGEVLSFVDNFSKAVARCSGEYVCMIGDDDTVLPNILSIVKYAKDNAIDAVIPQLLTYFWPTDRPIKREWRNGFLSSLPFRKEKFTIIDPIQSLKKLIQNNFQNYQKLNVPRIYHGIVKRKCIEDIKRISGVYFGGLTPDMFMSVCLCFTAPTTIVYSKPFTISGICPSSGSADSATGRHTGELKDAPHFRGHYNYKWISSIPYIYTVETIWAETGMQALKMMHREDFAKYYSPKTFAIILANKYPQFADRLLEFGEPYGIKGNDIQRYRINHKIFSFISLYTNRLKKLISRNVAKKIYNVNNIKQACDICCSILKINK